MHVRQVHFLRGLLHAEDSRQALEVLDGDFVQVLSAQSVIVVK